MEEWLGFSGQDARKSWFWTTRDQARQKDFLVRLSSLKDELAHRTPIPLKPKSEIVRQNLEPEARLIRLVM
ncbi:hypothetical protein [Vibrio gazogenes]|uniref:Uncharacterized protein n=1 Tax=Vibrio gazogenes DSM 21264 = NBRC 103151 TaxID=1123492 RepID=A0A1M4SAW6_VIBGA|nr:hypothetical protein [Vibrio gazogenes]USP15818.1 hypothetical protein MKS89_20795 [Vibrio gazogenes]SHE29383.1 hypothetical protein SAMN02745781_00011 [Vibrio gazogenes DSM 21264] [Vibrio gazogenes DSM 21264 = NBRC 103151]